MAILLPPAKQQFFDANGVVCSMGTVTLYVPGTTTLKDSWQDSGQSMLNTNPIALDIGGYATIYGNGSYRQIVKDRLGNQVWDRVVDGYSTTPGNRVAFSTYASMAAASTFPANTTAEVPTTDAGTHTDPVVGGTVNNSGVFRYSASPAGWQRMFDFPSVGAQGPAGASGTAGAAGTPGAAGPAGANSGTGANAAARSAMAAIPSPTVGAPVILTEAGREGTFVWTTGNLSTSVTNDPRQGVYVPPSTDTTGASGAWVRKYDGKLNVKWFGTVGDNATNDAPAIQAAINYLNSVATTGFGYSNGPGVLFIPRGRYYLGTTPLDVTLSMIIEGESVGGESGPATVLRWAYGTSGIRLQAPNTSGDSTIIPTTYLGAAGCVIENLYLEGGWYPSVPATGIEAEQHGIHMKVKATVRNCYINKWAGDGIHIWAASGSGVGSTEGNANLWYVERVACNNVRDGMNIKGSDANAGTSIMLSVINARRWGINEQSFLGNVHIQSHTASCGASEGNTTLAGMVSYNGYRYVPIVGQEAGASTNPPSGTTADNTWWMYAYAGGANTNITYIPLWTNGMSVRSSGGITTTDPNARNLFLNPYTEADTPSQLIKPTMILGGLTAGRVIGTMAYVTGTLQGTSLYNDVLVGGNLGLPGTLSVGAYNSTTNSAMEMDTGLNNNVFTFRSYVGGTPTSDLVITSRKGASATFDAPNGYTYNVGGGVKAEFTTGTVNLYGGIYVSPQAAAPSPLYNGQFWYDSVAGNFRKRENSQTIPTSMSAAPTGGVGYATGAGGAVAQATSKTTGVTLNNLCGQITLNNASLAANGVVSFTLTNSNIAATDVIRINTSGAATPGSYLVQAEAPASGSCTVSVRNLTAGALAEALVLNFAIIKSVAA